MVKETIVNLFDTETTGLCIPKENDLNKQPHLIEIYVLKVLQKNNHKFEVIDELDLLIKPPVDLSRDIIRITGITEKDLEGKKSFAKHYLEIAQFFTGCDRMVAHNVTFDRNVLLYELARMNKQLNFPWPIQHVCTVEKSMKIEQRRMKLTNLYKHLTGKEFKDAHRAKNDVEALYGCYKEMVKQGMIL